MRTELIERIKVLAGALVCTAALVLPLTVSASEEIDSLIEMPADGLVRVDNVAGSVEIESWERSAVEVKGEAGDTVEKVEIETNKSGVQIIVRNRKDTRRIDATELRIRIPRTASVEAESVSADITVRGSAGERIALETVSGDLEVESNPRQLELQTVSGDIDFSGSTARSESESVSGDVSLAGVSGDVRVSTVSGDISLKAGEINRGRFEVVSGDMNLDLALADGGRLDCKSMSGDVHLRLPKGQEAEFTVQTYSGNASSDFGEPERVSTGPGKALDYRVGDNGAIVRVETFSGNASLRHR